MYLYHIIHIKEIQEIKAMSAYMCCKETKACRTYYTERNCSINTTIAITTTPITRSQSREFSVLRLQKNNET